MNQQMFDETTHWQSETFPNATALSCICHLEQELYELKYDLISNNPERRLDYADYILLIIGAAKKDGLSYGGLISSIE